MHSFLSLIWIKNIIWMIHDLLNTVFKKVNNIENYWNERFVMMNKYIWILNKFLRYNYLK